MARAHLPRSRFAQVTRRVVDLTPAEYAACWRANFGDDGPMREQLEYERLHRRKLRGVARAYMTWDTETGRLAGWALLFPHGRGLELHVYVKHAYRRRGLGSSLRSRALKGARSRTVYVHAWSPSSSALYERIVREGRARNIHVDQ